MTIPSSPLQEAVELLRAKQPQEATKVLISFLKANPDSEDGWYLLSFAIPDLDKKQKSLERVLQINPNHTRARERLQKLQSPPKRKPPSTLPQPKKKSNALRNIVFVLIVVVLFGGGVFGVWWITQNLAGVSPAGSTVEVANQPAAQSTATPTPEPSSTVTSTPTNTPSLTPTATLQVTELIPTFISNFTQPEGDLTQQMDDIQNQVSTLRGLDVLVDSPRYIIPESDVNPFLSSLFADRYTQEMVDDEVRVLSILGLIKPTYNLYDQSVKKIGEGLGGFYIPWSDDLFVIGEGFTGVEKLIFAHEYDHALTDQHYHLENVGVYPECLNETDRCSAIRALVEGDATELMYQWLDTYGTQQDLDDIEAEAFAPIDKVITSNDIAPPYMIRETYFDYYDGEAFVKYLIDLGGWERVNAAYQNLPLSTEQILHPEKYINGEVPYPVELRSLDGVLDDSWRLLTTETLGELTTQMILGFHEHVLVQLDYETAQAAAAGWSGDSYQVYYRGTSNHSILVANWKWDDQAEAAEFWEAMLTYQTKRYMNKAVEGTSYDCWTKLNDHYSCIYQTDTDTLWIIAPTMELITSILDQYPEFK